MGIMKETTEVKNLVEKMQSLIGKVGIINASMIKKDLYDKAKEQLTALSAEFILQETANLSDKHVSEMLALSKKMVASRVELPDYYSLTGAFQVASEKQIPVVLKIKACLHAHRYQQPGTPFDVGLYLVPKKGKFKVKPLPSTSNDFPVIVVEAKRSGLFIQEESSQDYAKRLVSDFDFMKICAMDGAQHKQYTVDALGEVPSQAIAPLQLEEYAEEAKKVDQLKAQAETVGCSFSNQSLLILSHIFADKFSNQLDLQSVFQQTAEWIGLPAAPSTSGGV